MPDSRPPSPSPFSSAFDADATLPLDPDRTLLLPKAPDGTQEVDAQDILSVAHAVARLDAANRTQELDGDDILEVHDLAQQLDEAPQPFLHSPSFHPASDAPFAVDLAPPPSEPPLSMIEMRRASGIPDRPRSKLALVAGLAASAIVVIGVTAAALSRSPSTTSAAAQPLVGATEPDREIVAAGTETAGIEVTPEPVVVAVVAAPVAPPAAPAVQKPKLATPEKARASKTGVLRIPGVVSSVLVDGNPQKVTGGALVLKCGTHKIKLPNKSARVVNVPCGGNLTL